MEARLAQFRAEKQRQQIGQLRRRRVQLAWSRVAHSLHTVLERLTPDLSVASLAECERLVPVAADTGCAQLVAPETVDDDDSAVDDDDEVLSWREWCGAGVLYTLLKVLLWLVLFAISVVHQFGAAFFLVTAIPIIYYNTSTRRKVKGEPSAYSVFNPNCEPIQGTLTAEQLQREMMFGFG